MKSQKVPSCAKKYREVPRNTKMDEKELKKYPQKKRTERNKKNQKRR